MENSIQIAWDYLERTGDLGDPTIASKVLLESVETLVRRGERRVLMLSNKAISDYKRLCRPPVGVGHLIDPDCQICFGLGWVCENHPFQAWDEKGCQCGAACHANVSRPTVSKNPTSRRSYLGRQDDSR